MKDLIRNILRETVRPEWLKDFESKSREGRVEHIENNIARNRKLMPKIIEFLESKLGDNLIKIKVEDRTNTFGNEWHSTQIPEINFYLKECNGALKNEIRNDLGSYFDIHIGNYGTGLGVKYYELTWREC